MSKFVPIKFEERERVGKEQSKKLRKEGYIPVTFYGPDYPQAQNYKVVSKDFLPLIRHSHWESLRMNVSLPNGKEEMAILRDLQRNVVTDEVLHMDAYQLVAGHKVRVSVPVRVINKELCPGVKEGGVFEQVHHDVEIEVLPREIPEEILIDAANLAKGDHITAGECVLPESAELNIAPEEVLVMVVEPRIVLEEEEEELEGEGEEGASMDVEVLSSKKTEE
ncbi:MAG TPA: 50S ribosomal protein L25 [Synergistaceae bacterium]|nr:50S ribosomal protein L25 [Synergistaceae bacterium]HPJ26343.1 50S ribosomal protein L25 [Synergistaceae bacterium]HPQ38113.1 50S ribosomal protein L25 [Synergistaceae bacterium]